MPKRPRLFFEPPAAKPRRRIPFDFVLDALEGLPFDTRPMFGCLAVYLDDKVLLVLRERERDVTSNGVWIATTPEHHASLRSDFPHLRDIPLFGPEPTGWQMLSDTDADFEDAALAVCELIRQGDPRIGKPRGAKIRRKPTAKPRHK